MNQSTNQPTNQAIMVIGHGDSAPVLQETINVLDNEKIDFFIHWDKKNLQPKLHSKKSKIFFVDPIEVRWGTDTQIKAELLLMQAVQRHGGYTMAHLISAADMPLMDANYFLNYFDGRKSYLGFSQTPNNIGEDIVQRIKYYWPDRDLKGHKLYIRLFIAKNKLLGTDRLKDHTLQLYKGANWFSINTTYFDKVIMADKTPFFHSFCADELFMQTILPELNWQDNKVDDNTQAARYVDWGRGTPYTFKIDDVMELERVKNTKYAFARKVIDPSVVKAVFV